MSRRPGARPELNTHRWQKTRARVKARDGHACVCCGSTRNLSVHHIIKARFGGTDDESNLQTVCSRCHTLLDRPGSRHRRPRERNLVAPAGPWSRAW
jgi:5-methylcytosine-specific restriction endonuclease McrA